MAAFKINWTSQNLSDVLNSERMATKLYEIVLNIEDNPMLVVYLKWHTGHWISSAGHMHMQRINPTIGHPSVVE